MPAAQIETLEPIFEDSDGTIMARIRGTTGDLITIASIASISLKIYDDDIPPTTDNPTPEIQTRTLTVASSVFDTLQTDAKWSKDSTGYNFAYSIVPADVPSGSKTMRFEFLFTNASGKVWPVVKKVPVEGLYRS